MLTYYYELCLTIINKEIVHKNEQIIDHLIGYSILSYIIDEKDTIGKSSTADNSIKAFYRAIRESDISLSNEIHEIEKSESCESTLIRKMHKIAEMIILKVEKANFAAHLKKSKNRKSKTRRK